MAHSPNDKLIAKHTSTHVNTDWSRYVELFLNICTHTLLPVTSECLTSLPIRDSGCRTHTCEAKDGAARYGQTSNTQAANIEFELYEASVKTK